VKVGRVIFVGILALLFGSGLKGATVYVDAAGPNEPGMGTAADPFRQIQDGIDAANPNDIVEIRPGLYTGAGNYDLDPGGKSITIQGVSPFEPSVAAATIIDANGAGRGFYVHSGEDANCVIQGLTIRNCRTNGSGAAICCAQTSPVVNNCVISSCFSVYGGGAILCWDSSSAISNCILSNNSTSAKGGGIWLISADVTVSNCTISGNSATQYGGAIHCSDSTVELSNSILWANTAGSGNEIALSTSNPDQNSVAMVRYCDVQGGQAQVSAGANCTLQWHQSDISEEPLFASFDVNGDANTWDFHLQSNYGRWDSGSFQVVDLVKDGFIDMDDFAVFAASWRHKGESIPGDFDNSRSVDLYDMEIFSQSYLRGSGQGEWVYDAVISPCIDAGDPNLGWASEPWPNGRRVNMGAYGATSQASMNGNEADFNVDGRVDFSDFAYLGGKWGIEEYCIEDLSKNGVVDTADLESFAGNWLWHR